MFKSIFVIANSAHDNNNSCYNAVCEILPSMSIYSASESLYFCTTTIPCASFVDKFASMLRNELFTAASDYCVELFRAHLANKSKNQSLEQLVAQSIDMFMQEEIALSDFSYSLLFDLILERAQESYLPMAIDEFDAKVNHIKRTIKGNATLNYFPLIKRELLLVAQQLDLKELLTSDEETHGYDNIKACFVLVEYERCKSFKFEHTQTEMCNIDSGTLFGKPCIRKRFKVASDDKISFPTYVVHEIFMTK